MQPATVEIDLGFFPLMWILFLIRPRLAIDGDVSERRWGKHTVTLPAGHHVIEAWYPYLFSSQTSKGSIGVDLVAGGHYQVRYRPAWIVLLGGSMKLVGQPALPQATARALPPGAP